MSLMGCAQTRKSLPTSANIMNPELTEAKALCRQMLGS